jgi:5'-nucleotidase / UDP-sugar diphosphatase
MKDINHVINQNELIDTNFSKRRRNNKMRKDSFRKFIATAATATIATTIVGPAVSADTVEFKDVTDRYKEAVDFLVSKGAKGINQNQFGTHTPIKRVDAAVLIANVLGLDTEKAPDSGFKDVPDRAKGAVNALKKAGITNGKSTDQFGSSQPITRGEMAIWLQRGFDLKGSVELPFKDVKGDYVSAVEALYKNKITEGINKNQFGINQPIKRGDFSILLHKSAQYLEDDDDNFELTIMHTNDTHANLDKVAKKASAIKEVRAEKPDALLLDAGDVLTGTLYYNEFKGQADLEFMNLMGYDVMTFGNHEFDSGSTSEGHKVLADFIKKAKFPFVSANIDFSTDSNLSPLFKDEVSNQPEDGKIYNGIVKEVDGEKVGIFGLTTEETVSLSSPKVEFEDYIEEAEKAVDAFEEAGIDKIIALTHIGYDDNPDVDNDQELAKRVDGIDIIVGGHSHTKLEQPVVVEKDEKGAEKDPTVIVQAYQYNDFLGTLDVEFDDDGKVTGQVGELIAIADKEEDPAVAESLKEYSSKIDEVKNEPTGATTVAELPNPRTSDFEGATVSVRNSETALGNLITDGMLDKAKEFNPNTVIAMQNGGGIRAAIDKGELTVGEVITVLPFGNTLATMELTGAQIIEALEHGISQAPKESGGFLHVSGMKYSYDSSKAAGSRIVSVEVKGTDGKYKALDHTATYVVATNAFTAKGGDGYDVFKEVYEAGKVTDLGFSDWENLRDYVQKLKTVDPQIEGRIVDVNNN